MATLLWLLTLTRPTINCKQKKTRAKPYEAVYVQLAVQCILVYVSRRLRFWESAERLTRHGAVDGVAIIAILSCKEPGGEDQLILESQFRPSQGNYVIEVLGLLCPLTRAPLQHFHLPAPGSVLPGTAITVRVSPYASQLSSKQIILQNNILSMPYTSRAAGHLCTNESTSGQPWCWETKDLGFA